MNEAKVLEILEGLADAAKDGSLHRAVLEARSGPHPDVEALRRVALDQMDKAEALTVRAHTVLCLACSARLEAARADAAAGDHLGSAEIAELSLDSPIAADERERRKAHVDGCPACASRKQRADVLRRALSPRRPPLAWLTLMLDLAVMLSEPPAPVQLDLSRPPGVIRQLLSVTSDLLKVASGSGAGFGGENSDASPRVESFKVGDSVVLRGRDTLPRPLHVVVVAIEPAGNQAQIAQIVLPEMHATGDGIIHHRGGSWELLLGRASEPRCQKHLLVLLSADPALHEQASLVAAVEPLATRLSRWLDALRQQIADLYVELVPYVVT